jgi:hypothetical protein
MSIEPIKYEVRQLLARANHDIREAERTRASDGGFARVRAAGQLVFLQRQKQALEARLRELERSHDGAAPTLIQWVREDWMILMDRLESWIEAR